MRRVSVLLVLLAGLLGTARGADDAPQTADEQAIQRAVQAYMDAFNRGDAKALAALWSPEAAYTNPLTGVKVTGRSAIEQQFSQLFASEKKLQLAVQSEWVQMLSPNVALERGSATIVREDGSSEDSTYSAVYVKRSGKWLLDSVAEEDVPVVRSNYNRLRELEWMIGRWVDRDEHAAVVTECNWTKNRNFIVRSFTVSVRDRIETAGMQIIGWDPAAGKIRSWVFDSDGGFGEGTWSRQGKTWHIKQVGVTPDGEQSSSVNIIKYVDDDTFTWQSIQREVGGELLPNVDEVAVVRDTQE